MLINEDLIETKTLEYQTQKKEVMNTEPNLLNWLPDLVNYRKIEEYLRQQIQQRQIAVVNGQQISPPAELQPSGQPPSTPSPVSEETELSTSAPSEGSPSQSETPGVLLPQPEYPSPPAPEYPSPPAPESGTPPPGVQPQTSSESSTDPDAPSPTRPPSTDPLKAQCKEPKGQFPSESSCNKFINCWDETAVEQTCPAGLVFNPEKRYCDYPANVDCEKKN
ncbi:hypothetical protein AGLY_009683 [Aphis glycines]|uniref:Chitin-binding type-2 domain-containing protein n=1 Tax=Aphis glycines TaxID=307491 RepID=A0A6G0TIR1_APHGL|nr:hypothetical protein AGLY_009683 [Aphis glycines]